jgi:hypothetical protein
MEMLCMTDNINHCGVTEPHKRHYWGPAGEYYCVGWPIAW